MFYKTYVNNKPVFKSDIIKTEHFFTTRESIIKSKDSDYAELVEENKRGFCDYFQIPLENLLSPEQTHTSNVGIAERGTIKYPDTDGLIVASRDIAVFLNFADCTPIILYDEVKNIGAVVHAGWRGTAAGIAVKTVKRMLSDFDCNPKDVSAAIGPAIGFCCYNVKEDVLEQLKYSVKDFTGLFEIRQGEIFVDLKNINARQLVECGVENIDIAPYCACCNNDLFFSYRKEHGTTNRHSAVLKIH